MATLYISEFSQGVSGIGTTVAQMLPQPPVVEQTVAIGVGSVQSSIFNAKTRAVRLNTDVACSVLFGSNPTATAVNARLAANSTEYFAITPGQRLAVITNT